MLEELYDHYVDVFLASEPNEPPTSIRFSDATSLVSDVRSRLGEIPRLKFDAAALEKIVFLNKAKQTAAGPIRAIRDGDDICNIAAYEVVADAAAPPAERTAEGPQDGSRDLRLILAYRRVWVDVDTARYLRMTDR